MALRPRLAVLSLALACTAVVGCAGSEAELLVIDIGVAAAPSLAAAFTELIEVFENEHPGVRVSLAVGRSDDLADSLRGRTEINVFASASEEAMGPLVAEGVAVDPRIFARNHVVLAVPSGNPRGVAGLKDLERGDLRVGLCDAAIPCGEAADALLAQALVVPGRVERLASSRALTSQLAESQVDAGIVYRTDVAGAHGWVTEVEVDEREAALEESAGTTRYVLARVPGGDTGSDADSKAAAADEFTKLVLSDLGRHALQSSGLEPLTG